MEESEAVACLRLREAVETMRPLVATAARIGRQADRQGLEFAAVFLEQSIDVFIRECEEYLQS